MALTVNGRKAKIKRKDFLVLGKPLKIHEKAVENSMLRVCSAIPKMKAIIQNSFLTSDLKNSFKTLLDQRMNVLGKN